ncbi:ferritin-like domain-containing protein [Aquihabitans sp. G128]|uniref:ferritin-like domain-containing protein n=1 Tax=Aquihabitans sp. G128 TaxID=2849779 RepID=UPI001C225037|nr:ferritin-like domain-containing protein [Aquihabitans sp. G128]QXC59381.1 ferritin-like domain-containing protein [Aquihabitans sp. G128]
MTVDERGLRELIVESQDLQSDALRDMNGQMSGLADIREERRKNGVDLDALNRFNVGRRDAIKNGGMGLGAFAARGAIVGTFGTALAGLLAAPASAQDGGVDVQILQTAASLENLAVATYKAALGLDFIKNGNKVVVAFAEMTMKQHGEHGDAFNAMAKQLGGKEQKEANAKYNKVVSDALPSLTDAPKVVDLAATLEQVATETYVANMALLEDKDTKALMGSVMGVEAQHLAVLRAVGALLSGGDAGAALIAIPTDVAKLPAAAGSVSFPEPFQATDMASPPEEGAVK